MSAQKMGFVLSVATIFSSSICAWGADPSVSLQFGADKKFKIAQFTDLHWETWETDNQQSLDVMASVLDIERPDLVVLTGDIVPTIYATVDIWRDVVNVMQSRSIPWTVTLGNHDTESMTGQQVIAALSPMSYSLVEAGPTNIDGYGNSVLKVKDSTGVKIASALYCLDSQKRGLKSSQIQWYRDQSAALTQANGGITVPSLAFFHIPLPEYKYFDTPSLIKGKIGQKGESVVSSSTTNEMFNAMKEKKDIMGVFCGHDHWNDFTLFFDDVCLSYGRKTGVNGYGDLPYGGRIIELTEGASSFDSWIRSADGNVAYPFHFQQASVPEPSSLLMLLSGLAGWALFALHRKKRSVRR
jgi:hypothetical protein